MPRIYSSVLELIGDTPLIKLDRVPKEGLADILCKLEARNPSGSIKDRAAVAMVEDAEAKGILKSGSTIVEASSGNTGIALALVAAIKRFRLILTMPDAVPPERRHLLGRYGAQIMLTPSAEGMEGAVRAMRELLRVHPDYVSLKQFENLANPKAHREGTAVEIWEGTGGKVDAFVAGVGTSGTITGIGEFLKEKNPAIKVIAVEPASSPVLSGGSPRAHRIPGIGADFVPPLFNRKVIDQIIVVSDDDALGTAALLAKDEGLLVGPSSGANVFASLQVAEELGKGRVVVTILPDSGERYVGSPFEL